MMNARLMLAAAAVCVARATPLPNYEYSCIHYCESLYGPEVRPYCCRMAKVFQGEDSNNIEHRPTKEEILSIDNCPTDRSFCPRAGHYAEPVVGVTTFPWYKKMIVLNVRVCLFSVSLVGLYI
ncbi:uncharacterized protein LOC134786619 [Penaeus indicus]|uniref:uncharacterized protein LOC134786619 n=1 Tax=Penaeus indicus TaxID=29960 RepID=UPI00300D3AC2